MSKPNCIRVIIAFLLVGCLVIILIELVIEMMSMGESVVVQILYAILGTIFFLISCTLWVAVKACESMSRTRSDTGKVQRTYDYTSYAPKDHSKESEDTLLTYCPHCRYKLEIDTVERVGSSELTCPNCLKVFKARN